jgi:hypothetical protein
VRDVWNVREIPTVYYWGMHWYWWFFGVLLWMLLFSFMMPMRRSTYRQMQSPLQLLQRDMQPGRSQARNTKNGAPNYFGMRIRNRDGGWLTAATICCGKAQWTFSCNLRL